MQLKSKLIYPNPFTPVGIEFELSEEAIVSLTIMDEAGRNVQVPISNSRFGAGQHRCSVDLGPREGKHYIYRLVVKDSEGETVETRRIG